MPRWPRLQAGRREVGTETEAEQPRLKSVEPRCTEKRINLENTTLIPSGPWMSMRTSLCGFHSLHVLLG